MPSLYQLNHKVQELIAELDSLATDITSLELTTMKPEEIVADIEATIIETYEAIDKKREAYIHVIRNATADARALREEAKHLSTRAKRLETLATHLKDTLQFDMMGNGEVTATAGIFKLRVAKSPVRVELECPPELLPKCFQKVAVSANTNALRKALKDGDKVPGAKLHQGTHLRIS